MLRAFLKSISRSAPLILLLLTFVAAISFAAVSHLVARYNANQQARGRKLYDRGLSSAKAGNYGDAIAEFRAALTCEPANSQYQLSLARALRDSNDPRRLDEAESYLVALWQRTPQDAAVNLALARVAAHRGNIEDATRYYHNAMYGVWNSNADANRNKARIELIQFLIGRQALANADSELIALATSLPSDPAEHMRAAELFVQARDDAGALAQYKEVLLHEPTNAAAMAGAGRSAYDAGAYTTADHYLQAAVRANPQDTHSRELLATTELILHVDPFRWYISDAERNRRIATAFDQAEKRLQSCAAQVGVNLSTASPSPLSDLQATWTKNKPELANLRSDTETDLPDTLMDIVFQIEQKTSEICGSPQGPDLALLLISQKRETSGQ